MNESQSLIPKRVSDFLLLFTFEENDLWDNDLSLIMFCLIWTSSPFSESSSIDRDIKLAKLSFIAALLSVELHMPVFDMLMLFLYIILFFLWWWIESRFYDLKRWAWGNSLYKYLMHPYCMPWLSGDKGVWLCLITFKNSWSKAIFLLPKAITYFSFLAEGYGRWE